MKIKFLISFLLISNFIFAQKNANKKHHFSVEVPFVVDTCNSMVIIGSIDKQPVRLLVGITYPTSLIDLKYKRKKSKYPLRLGNFTFKNTKLNAIKLEDASLSEYDGVLGNDFFSQGILQLDYINKKIKFVAELANLDNIENQQKMPIHHLSVFGKGAFIPLRIDGNYITDLCLANNLNTTLLLPKATFDKVIPAMSSKKFLYSNDEKTIDTSSAFFLDGIKLHNSITLENQIFCADWYSEYFFGYLNVANLGTSTFTIDWQNHYCYFNQNKIPVKVRSYIVSDKDSTLKISGVRFDSPLLLAGMMPNDIIKSINDIEVHSAKDMERIFLENPSKDNVYRYKIIRNQKEMDFEVKF